jgi:hypothetical protein
MFSLLVGGRAKFIALVAFNMVALTELRHVIETAAAARYTPGVVTAIPYIVLGVLFLRALFANRARRRFVSARMWIGRCRRLSPDPLVADRLTAERE